MAKAEISAIHFVFLMGRGRGEMDSPGVFDGLKKKYFHFDKGLKFKCDVVWLFV